MRPLLLIIRTGKREFREYLLRSITPHYRVHMFVVAAPSWELDYIDGFTRVDTGDVDAMVKAAQDLEDISGVLCWDEARIPQAAEVAKALDLPGDPQATARCRDKHLTRQALAAAGVAQPQSIRVETVEQALAEADRLGYPVILKPTDLALSHGVLKVDTAAELPPAFEYISGIKHAGIAGWRATILLEEFVSGEEISVDTAVHRGELFPLCLAHKEIGYPPYCIEVGHYVYADDPLLQDPELLRLLRDTHKALGFTDGITHTEIMLTADGPKIIEVNGRLGGDMIPYLGFCASGVDTGLAASAVACDRAPEIQPDRKLVAAVRFFYPKEIQTVIRSIEFDFGAVGMPAAIDKLALLPELGTVKSPPPEGTVNGRIAFATAVAETAQECRDALDVAEKALRVNED
ncbi:MAG TPA: phosphoribosylglycinamide synthetase [Micromonosporaceae bacterium]|nr:phosphoribosylglycinamide synthetase [Micromonosporaceae bacterium]HCU49278.1 phosphoribosylglycinamide synthetase [Micromonosporaceae bacterium]